MKFQKNSKQFNLGAILRIQELNKNKKIKKGYKNKTQNWSLFKEKLINYNPFYYTQKAFNYPSNHNKWILNKDLLKQDIIYKVFISFYLSWENHRERKNVSVGVIVYNQDNDLVLQRCYYVGCKEPNYGHLIGITYVLKDLLKVGLKKVIIQCDTKVFDDFLNNKFKEEDPYQEKTSNIMQDILMKFDQIKIQKFKENQIIQEANQLAEWVQTNQMKNFLNRIKESKDIEKIIKENNK